MCFYYSISYLNIQRYSVKLADSNWHWSSGESSNIGHRYNFIAINSVSKESINKRKELEQIIAAYCIAIDKLAMVYMQIKMERDSRAKIWETIKNRSA